MVPHERRLTSRAAGRGTLRVPLPDFSLPEDRGSSFVRFAGIEMGLFCWGRNPSFLFLETGRVPALSAVNGVLDFLAEGQ